MKFGRAPGRAIPADHANRRLAGGIAVSLLLHALVLLLQFGMPGLGVPGARPPLTITIANAELPPPVPPAPPLPVVLPESAVPPPPLPAPAQPLSGMRLVDPRPAPEPVPAPPVAKARPKVLKGKPKRAKRISSPVIGQETVVEPSRVIAQDATLNDFVVPLARPEEAEEKTIDPKEAQHGEDEGEAAVAAAAEAEAARAGKARAEEEARALKLAEEEEKRAEEEKQRLAALEFDARKAAEEQAARRQAEAAQRQAQADQQKAEEAKRQDALAAQQRAELQRQEQQRAQLQRAEELKAEQERVEQQRAEQLRVEQLRVEEQRAEQKKAEQQIAERQKAEQLKQEQQRAEQLRQEQQRIAELQKAEQQRAEQKAEQQKAEQQRIAEQQRVAEQQKAEQQRIAEQRAADQRAADQRAADQRGRELAGTQPGSGGTGAAGAGAGGPGGKVTIPKNLLGGDLANRAREMVKGLDVLSGAPPVRSRGDRRAVVGASERDLNLKMYVESWRQKLERNGAINYPRSWADLDRNDPLVSVAVRSDGTVEDVTILSSSGRADMDEAVRRIVRVNARYSPFPPNIAERYDVIEIRRVWRFDYNLKLLEEVR